MPAFLEPLPRGSLIMRIGQGTFKYSDPFSAAAVVVPKRRSLLDWLGGLRACTVKALVIGRDCRMTKIQVLRDTQVCLREAGFTEFHWDRERESGTHPAKART